MSLPSSSVSREYSSNAWQLVDYETAVGGGTMLATRNGIVPPPVTIKLNLTGWHRLYVCLVSGAWLPKSGISLKLTDDVGPSFFVKSLPKDDSYTWRADENCEEYFWECADLTGQSLTIAKLPDHISTMIGLMWIRTIPMTDAEVEEYKKELARKDTKILHAHTDMDWLELLTNAENDDLFAPFLQDMAKSDVGVVSVEFYPLLTDYEPLETMERQGLMPYLDPRLPRQREYSLNRNGILGGLTRVGHEIGLKLYSALRIALTECPYPSELFGISGIRFVKEHPEFFCVDRDGEIQHTLSLAFKEVQDYLIEEFLKTMDFGFDGVTLFFHRGIMMLFEKPVVSRCRELYPDVDPRCLPVSDERLAHVRCELMSVFMRRLRSALDVYSSSHACQRKNINVIVGFSCKEDRYYGVDVAKWAEEKLIDSFIPSNMCVWEEDSDYRDDNFPDLIDLDKYKVVKFNSAKAPVRRVFSDDLPRMIENLPVHLDICRRTSVKCYIEIPWECTRSTEFLHDYACKLYAAGAEALSLWDCFHVRVMNRAEWNLVSKFGHKSTLPSIPKSRDAYGTLYRVLSYNNVSIASYHPSWRG